MYGCYIYIIRDDSTRRSWVKLELRLRKNFSYVPGPAKGGDRTGEVGDSLACATTTSALCARAPFRHGSPFPVGSPPSQGADFFFFFQLFLSSSQLELPPKVDSSSCSGERTSSRRRQAAATRPRLALLAYRGRGSANRQDGSSTARASLSRSLAATPHRRAFVCLQGPRVCLGASSGRPRESTQTTSRDLRSREAGTWSPRRPGDDADSLRVDEPNCDQRAPIRDLDPGMCGPSKEEKRNQRFEELNKKVGRKLEQSDREKKKREAEKEAAAEKEQTDDPYQGVEDPVQ